MGHVADAPDLAKTVQRLWLGLGLGKDIGNTLYTKTLLVSPPAGNAAAAIEKLGSLCGWSVDIKQELKTKWTTRAAHQGFFLAAMDRCVSDLGRGGVTAPDSDIDGALQPGSTDAMSTQRLPEDVVPPTTLV